MRFFFKSRIYATVTTVFPCFYCLAGSNESLCNTNLQSFYYWCGCARESCFFFWWRGPWTMPTPWLGLPRIHPELRSRPTPLSRAEEAWCGHTREAVVSGPTEAWSRIPRLGSSTTLRCAPTGPSGGGGRLGEVLGIFGGWAWGTRTQVLQLRRY